MIALVLDGHSRAAVESVQSLGRARVAVAVAAGSSQALAFRSRYVKLRLEQPPSVPFDRFLEWLTALDAEHSFDLIIPSTEASLLAMMQIDEGSSLRRRAVLPSQSSLDIALDKDRTLTLAAGTGVPIPQSRLITSLADIDREATFPCVLKPVRSKVATEGGIRSVEPAIVTNATARRRALENWLPSVPVIEQEYICGWGVGVEVLYRNGSLAWYVAHERLHEWPLTGGASTYRRTIEPDPAMVAAARRLFDKLQWHGVGMAEFKRREDGSFALMEINPRLWGSLALSADAGVDFPIGLLKIACGMSPGPQPSYRRGIRTRHLSKDLRWIKSNFGADRTNPLLLLRPKIKSVLELTRPLAGGEHWDHFQWTDPGPFLHDTFREAGESLSSLNQRLRTRLILTRRNRFRNRARQCLRNVARPTLLFVCLGNICRSPFAEIVARAKLPNCQVRSAGLDPRLGRATPQLLREQAAQMGFNMSDCRSTQLCGEHVSAADLILVMDLANYDQIRARFPHSRDKVVLLGLFGNCPAAVIEDPDRKDEATTVRVLLQIVSAVEGLGSLAGGSVGAAHQPEGHSRRSLIAE